MRLELKMPGWVRKSVSGILDGEASFRQFSRISGFHGVWLEVLKARDLFLDTEVMMGVARESSFSKRDAPEVLGRAVMKVPPGARRSWAWA